MVPFLLLLLAGLVVPLSLVENRPDEVLTPGDRGGVRLTASAPDLPAKLDLVFLMDETGSFEDDAPFVHDLLPDAFEEIANSSDFRYGLAGFGDGDVVSELQFEVVEDLSPYGPNAAQAIRRLDARADWSNDDAAEMSLAALDRVLQEFEFRPDATSLVILSTDASSKVFPPDYTAEAVAKRYQEAGITIVALQPVTYTDPDSSGGPDQPVLRSQLETLTSVTGGSVEDLAGSSQNLDDAVLRGLGRLPFEVTPRMRDGCPVDDVDFSPRAVVGSADGTGYELAVTYRVRPETASGRWICTVDLGDSGDVTFEIQVTGG